MTSLRAAAVCSPQIFVFCKVSQSNNEYFLLLFSPFYRSANVPFHLFPRKSVNHVTNQPKQPTFSYLSPKFRFRTNIAKLSTAMYPFRISLYEHVPLKFLMTKRLRKIKIYIYCTNKHLLILKIILTDVDLCYV